MAKTTTRKPAAARRQPADAAVGATIPALTMSATALAALAGTPAPAPEAPQTYSTASSARRAAHKALGDGAFKIIPAGDRFAIEPIKTETTDLPPARMLKAPPVIQDGGAGLARLRASEGAEALRQDTLKDGDKIAALPDLPAAIQGRAIVLTSGNGSIIATAADEAPAAALSASEKAAANRATGKTGKIVFAEDAIKDRLTSAQAKLTIDAMNAHGAKKGRHARVSADSLPHFRIPDAIDALRAYGEKGDAKLIAATLKALGASAAAPAKAAPGEKAPRGDAPKEGTTARGIFDLLRRPGGATAAEMKAAGFKDVSVMSSAKDYAARFGYAISATKDGKFDRVALIDKPADAKAA